MNKAEFGTEPHKLHRVEGPDTSIESAYSVDSKKLEQMVYETIRSAGRRGLISDEVRDMLPQVRSYSSITARFSALKNKKLIVTDGKRPGFSGRNQAVLVAKELIDNDDLSLKQN